MHCRYSLGPFQQHAAACSGLPSGSFDSEAGRNNTQHPVCVQGSALYSSVIRWTVDLQRCGARNTGLAPPNNNGSARLLEGQEPAATTFAVVEKVLSVLVPQQAREHEWALFLQTKISLRNRNKTIPYQHGSSHSRRSNKTYRVPSERQGRWLIQKRQVLLASGLPINNPEEFRCCLFIDNSLTELILQSSGVRSNILVPYRV